MLPISEMSIIEVDKLNVGDFAILHELQNAPAFVASGGFGGVLIRPDFEGPQVDDLRQVYGLATKVTDCEFRVDERSATTDNHNEAGYLVLYGTDIALSARSNRAVQIYRLAELDASISPKPVAFTRWQLIKRIGEQVHILYERK